MFKKSLMIIAIASFIPLQAFAEKDTRINISGQNYAKMLGVAGGSLQLRKSGNHPNKKREAGVKKRKASKVKPIYDEVEKNTNTDNDVVF